MYRLNVITDFSAAHKLLGYQGACQNLHGHNWKVKVAIDCQRTDKIGMTIDYGIVKEKMNEVLKKLDHKYLNEIADFRYQNPTSENIAHFFFSEMKELINSENCQLAQVEIWESDNTSVIYSE